MRVTLSILVIFSTLLGHSQNKAELQQLGSAGKLNLVPRYGYPVIIKEDKYVAADRTFIDTIRKKYTTREAANELVLLGFDYFYKTKLQTAIRRFNQAWLIDSTNAGVYFGFWLVQATISTNEVRTWLYGKNINQVNEEFSPGKYFKIGQSLDSNHFYEKIALGYGCSSLDGYKQPATAKESCIARLKFDPNDTITLQNLANAYTESGQFEDALKIQKRHLTNSKAKGFVYNDIAWIFQQMNKLDSAETYYLKSIQNSDESYFKARINYCFLMEQKGQCAPAIPVIDKCITTRPAEGFFHYTKGKLLLCAGRKDEAIESLKTAKKLGNDDAKELLKEIKK